MNRLLKSACLMLVFCAGAAFATSSGVPNSDSIRRVSLAEATVSSKASFALQMFNLSTGAVVNSNNLHFGSIPFTATTVEGTSFSPSDVGIKLIVTNNNANWSIIVYTDNTNSVIAIPKYTGTNQGMNGQNPSGLISASGKNTALLMWENATNFSGWKTAPVTINPATASTTNWAIMRDIGSSDYVWNPAQADYMTVIKGGSGFYGLPGGRWTGGFVNGKASIPTAFTRFYGRFFGAVGGTYRSTTLTFELFHQ